MLFRSDFSILLGIKQRTLLRPYHFKQLENIKSSLLTKQTIPPQMFNSYLGQILRRSIKTADSSSPATTRTRSLNLSIPDVQLLNLVLREKKKQNLQENSSSVSGLFLRKKVSNLSKKFLHKLSTLISQIGGES